MPIPRPILTERLIIRTPTQDDASELNAAVLESLESLRPWMPWAEAEPTLDESREKCLTMAANTAEGRDFVLFAFDRESGRMVLASGMHPQDMEVPFFNIGYWCRSSYLRKGYVTEAVNAITEACFEQMGARRIEIRCDSENLASRAVAERCGYRFEGELVNECRDRFGRLRSTLIFASTRDDS